MQEIKRGIYQHFKGGMYRLVDIARHSETMEEMVIYQKYDKESEFWVRPKDMFFEKVIVNGCEVERFKFINE